MQIEYFTFSERDFQAELYHQCRFRFSRRKINSRFPNDVAVEHPITLTAESGKSISAALDNHGIAINGTIPDLLFHNPVGLDSQWCVAEIKQRNLHTNTQTVTNDISKLLNCVSGGLSFRHAIFILNNISRHKLTVKHGYIPGDMLTTANIIELIDNQIALNNALRSEYIEIWIVNPPLPDPNDQDWLFTLERTFHDTDGDGQHWRTRHYVRRGKRLTALADPKAG